MKNLKDFNNEWEARKHFGEKPFDKDLKEKCHISAMYSKDNNKDLHFYCEFCGKEMQYDEDRICEAKSQENLKEKIIEILYETPQDQEMDKLLDLFSLQKQEIEKERFKCPRCGKTSIMHEQYH